MTRSIDFIFILPLVTQLDTQRSISYTGTYSYCPCVDVV